MPKVTDPAVLSQLNGAQGGGGLKPPEGYHRVSPTAVAPDTNGPGDLSRIANEERIRAGIQAAKEISTHRAILAMDKASQAEPFVKVDPNAPTGDAYLKTLPGATGALVKALATGRTAFPTGAGMRSPYWQQMLQSVAQYDPSFDAVNFTARNAMRKDFVEGKTGQNIKALNTALGHAQQLYSQIDGTYSGGGYPFATDANAVANFLSKHYGTPGVTNFNDTAGKLASELTSVFRNGSGAEQDVTRNLGSLSENASRDQKVGVIKNTVGLLNSRLAGIADQYRKGMGTTADPVQILDPQAQKFVTSLGITPASGGGGGPSGGPPGGPGGPPDLGGGPVTGPTKTVRDPKVEALIDGMVRHGMTADQINSVIVPAGMSGPVDEKQVGQVQDFLKLHPDYKGGFTIANREDPTSLLNRAAGSPLGTGIGAAVDAGLGGMSDEIAAAPYAWATGKGYSDALNQLNAAKQSAFAANPKSAFAGATIGAIGPAVGATTLLRGTAMARLLGKAAPYVGGIAQGAITGAGENNDNRAAGAVGGGIGGGLGALGGQLAARPMGALIRTGPGQAAVRALQGLPKIGSAFSGMTPASMPSPSPAEIAINRAALQAGKGGVDLPSMLGEASQLGVPMSLSDTSPQLTSLAGAAVRRSPNADQVAQNALLPRARGQIDRLGAAVNRDLGPTSDVPQLSQDLRQEAQTAAAPLYDKAYAAPGASSVQLDDLINRPLSMQPALKRAYTIAVEEGRDPKALGFDIDQEGNVTISKVPSFQTLDYAKRGLDDILEPHRDAITGKLALNEATRAINNTKNTLLSRMDAVNPDYAAARQAYGGPMQARDALASGQDAFNPSMSPDEVRMMAGAQSPSNLPQMQLGYRSALMKRAGDVRDTSNPFEATLGTANARAKIDALYPGNPGNGTLFRTRDMEQQLARAGNDVLGNSKTAQRGIADQAFQDSPLADIASAGITMAAGGVPVGSIVKRGALQAAREAYQFGLGKKAVAKADDLAPMLFNTDPAASSAMMDDIAQKIAAYGQYLNATRPYNGMGFFGRGAGTAAGSGY
jgi:hypothetical protein